MNTIEKHLHEHFASLKDAEDVAPVNGTTSAATMMGDSIPETLDVPFARVNSVAANSPAESAGLKAGDEVRNFGYVNRANNDGLKKVAECVQGNQGVSPRRTTTQLVHAQADHIPISNECLSRYRDAQKEGHGKSCSSILSHVVAGVAVVCWAATSSQCDRKDMNMSSHSSIEKLWLLLIQFGCLLGVFDKGWQSLTRRTTK